MAYIDSLTMIYNRRGIQEKFNQCRDEKREYSIILCDIDAYVLWEQIRKKIEGTDFSYEGEVISITITIGIGEVKDFLTREAILIADKNLYIGKRNGKNIVIK